MSYTQWIVYLVYCIAVMGALFITMYMTNKD